MTRSDEKNGGQPATPEEYAKLHQRSFRVAFDFLASHFPPGQDPEWWEKTAQDASRESILAGEGKLVVELLAGVYEYLEYEYKQRRDQNGET